MIEQDGRRVIPRWWKKGGKRHEKSMSYCQTSAPMIEGMRSSRPKSNQLRAMLEAVSEPNLCRSLSGDNHRAGKNAITAFFLGKWQGSRQGICLPEQDGVLHRFSKWVPLVVWVERIDGQKGFWSEPGPRRREAGLVRENPQSAPSPPDHHRVSTDKVSTGVSHIST